MSCSELRCLEQLDLNNAFSVLVQGARTIAITGVLKVHFKDNLITCLGQYMCQ